MRREGGQGTTDARRTDAPYVADAANEEGGQVTDEACQETPDEGGFGPLAYAYVTDDAGLEPLVTEVIAATGPIALDTETFDPNLGPDDPVADGDALDVRVAQVRLIQVRTAGGEPWLVDGLSVDPAPLLEVIKDKALIMHNAKYDLAVLRTNFGYVHDGPVSDTMLAAQVLYAGRPNVGAGLEELADSLLEIEIDKGQQRTYWGAEPLSDAQLNYAAADVEYLHELDEVLRARVKKSRGLPDVVDLENRMVKVIAEMTAVGMPVDERVFAECVDESDTAIAEQRTKLDALITAPIPEVFVERNTKNKENVPEERNGLINWDSNPQILWAFESAGLKLPATNKGVLADYEGNPLVDALLALRQKGDVARRFCETRVEGGRAHATWKQIEAKTGRMACENPPLQGVPEALKRAFVAPPGHKLVVSDLSQIEIRVLAALSGDENLRQEFLKGTDGDIHRAVAANVLGIPREDVTKQQRGLAKSLVFGLVYGQGLKGFSDKAREVFRKNYTEEEVDEKFWRPFFEAYAGVAQWRDKVVHRFNFERQRDAYTQMGRRRLHLTSHRQALNSPIQGGAADVMKSIAVAVYERRSEAPGLEIVGLIHDEILVTVPEEHAAAAAELVHEIMKEVGEEVTNIGVDEDRRVPVDAATQVCGCWAEKG